jgi:hypothetical protein
MQTNPDLPRQSTFDAIFFPEGDAVPPMPTPVSVSTSPTFAEAVTSWREADQARLILSMRQAHLSNLEKRLEKEKVALKALKDKGFVFVFSPHGQYCDSLRSSIFASLHAPKPKKLSIFKKTGQGRESASDLQTSIQATDSKVSEIEKLEREISNLKGDVRFRLSHSHYRN